MKVDIKIPSFGESILEATIGTILKPSGSVVRADEEILELETDKLNQPLYAPAAGELQLTVKTGEPVKVGQIIGTIETTRPLLPEKSAPAPQPVPAPRPTGRETRAKMTKLRRIIAERLVAVKNQTAMLTTFNEVDMSAVIAVREKERDSFEKKYGVRLGYMSFFIKATVAALQQFPDINARIEGEEIVYCHYYDIGVAVSTDKGLMVPVIRGVDELTSAQIEKKLKELAEKARAATLSVDDLQGGTFTITNAGLYGSLLSTPLLNPPQSGILGMHNILKRPIAVDDQVAIRPMMYLALSYDHRLVDGVTAVSFLMHIKKSLEEPTRLVLDL